MQTLDRWLGNGGMPLISQLGAAIVSYGDGWAVAEWTPTLDACNPGGTVQAGVQAILLDAAMNFAIATRLPAGTRTATLEIKVSTMRPVPSAQLLAVRGEAVRVGRSVAFAQGWIQQDGEILSHCTSTFALRGA